VNKKLTLREIVCSRRVINKYSWDLALTNGPDGNIKFENVKSNGLIK
jgi:hypothetical protein